MTIQNLELSYGALTGETELPELVLRLRASEPAAIGEVYDAHHQAVRAFARRLLGEPQAAEDLVHDVFVTLPRAIQGYRGDASLRTFLISIAVNRARRFVRSATRQRAAMERMALEPQNTTEDPERLAQRRQLADALSRALAKLPLDQRVAFVLCDVEQRTSAEVSRIVRVPEGTVRTRLFHARKKLRQELEREGVQ